jgi:hypothetical protein
MFKPYGKKIIHRNTKDMNKNKPTEKELKKMSKSDLKRWLMDNCNFYNMGWDFLTRTELKETIRRINTKQ